MLATVTFTRACWLFSSPSPKEEVRSAAGVRFPLCPAPYPAPCVAAQGCPSWWSGSRHGVPGRRVRAGSTRPGATCKHAACSCQRARRSSPAGGNRNASWRLPTWPGPEQNWEALQDANRRAGMSSLSLCMGKPVNLAKPLSYCVQIKIIIVIIILDDGDDEDTDLAGLGQLNVTHLQASFSCHCKKQPWDRLRWAPFHREMRHWERPLYWWMKSTRCWEGEKCFAVK